MIGASVSNDGLAASDASIGVENMPCDAFIPFNDEKVAFGVDGYSSWA